MRLNLLLWPMMSIGIFATQDVSSRDAGALDVPAVVNAVMKDAYGDAYDAKNACWAYKFQDEQGELTHYCMRPRDSKVIEAKGQRSLYLSTSNATDIRDDSRYSYSHIQPGLMGVFKINLGEKHSWTYQAKDEAMDYGTAGDCGCAHARLVELDNAGDFGWLFASGGTWQGKTVANYSILAVIDGQIKDISEIPQIRENAQDVRYEVNIKSDSSVEGLLPLHVVETKAGMNVEQLDISFDPLKSAYVLPAGH